MRDRVWVAEDALGCFEDDVPGGLFHPRFAQHEGGRQIRMATGLGVRGGGAERFDVEAGVGFAREHMPQSARDGFIARPSAVYRRAGRPCPRCGTPIRSEDGRPIGKGMEVIVTRYEKGIAYVRGFDELTGS